MTDRNHISIIKQPKKIIADNEFKIHRITEFLDKKNIKLDLTKPNSHTGNADIERFHSTIAEFRILYKLEKVLSIEQLLQKTIRNYNDRFQSATKYTLNEVYNNKVDFE